MKLFPVGIYEDVFCVDKASHRIDILPTVGESETDFYCRALEDKISKTKGFPMDMKEEVLLRGRRLVDNFCKELRNRIYVIPYENIKDKEANFGVLSGARDGKATGQTLEKLLSGLRILDNLVKNVQFGIRNENFRADNGVAIYGRISNKGASYFEVEGEYTLM